jgi:aminomuconate-semialdehyde/2-hydroxymuconate-6-semialdehyde dehydrogenase
VDAAVRAARAALNGEWGGLTVEQRVELLYAVADEINRRFDDFLAAEMADTGKPSHVSHIDIPRRGQLQGLCRRGQERAHRVLQMATPDGGARSTTPRARARWAWWA